MKPTVDQPIQLREDADKRARIELDLAPGAIFKVLAILAILWLLRRPSRLRFGLPCP
ncbi:MAG: hypothetical protein HY319_26065 [Armatimonadetes bacterium]|nr:hypothetical protein [Armatimonadota bacterium]